MIPTLVCNEDNALLTKISSLEEVKESVYGMNGDGAPSPDGFGGCFFQSFWDIICTDVYNSVC